MTFHDMRIQRRAAILRALYDNPVATLRQIGDVVGLKSVSAVHRQLETLEDAGLIEQRPCHSCGGFGRYLTDQGAGVMEAIAE